MWVAIVVWGAACGTSDGNSPVGLPFPGSVDATAGARADGGTDLHPISADSGSLAPDASGDSGNRVDAERPARQFDAQVADARPRSDVPTGPSEERRVRVGTYNVMRFFDTRCDTEACGPEDFEGQPTAAMFAARADQIAEAIEEIDADVLLVQEIETESCLAALRLRLGDRYRTSMMGETGGPASLDVAVLANGDILHVDRHRGTRLPLPDGTTTRFFRELLEVHLNIDGAEVVVFNGHFRSKVNDDPAQRLAEAQGARRIAVERAAELPHALIIVGGDFNDTPGSPPLEALEEGGDLLRVAAGLGRRAATYRWNGEGVAIDHLFMARHAGGRYVPSSAAVISGAHIGLGGSDHAALVAACDVAIRR